MVLPADLEILSETITIDGSTRPASLTTNPVAQTITLEGVSFPLDIEIAGRWAWRRASDAPAGA